MKTYEITYTPNLELTQKVVNLYEPWDCMNVTGVFIYVSLPNHDKSVKRKIYVNAISKETAKAMFAIAISDMYLGKPIENGVAPMVFDAIRNIVSITDVTPNE